MSNGCSNQVIPLGLLAPDAARRADLVKLLGQVSQFRVASSGPDFDSVTSAAEDCPVFVIDLAYERAGRPQFWAALRVLRPASRLVALTDDPSNLAVMGSVLHAGAYPIVEWSDVPDRIIGAVWATWCGRPLVPLGDVLLTMMAFFDSEHRPPAVLHLQDLKLDLVQRLAGRAGQPIELSAREFELLVFFAQHVGRIVTRDELARQVWHQAVPTGDPKEYVKFAVNRLRRKIEPDPRRPSLIKTVRGHGYLVAGGTGPK